LKITQSPIITVIGKAFFDIGHAPQIIQTRELILKATLPGKYIRGYMREQKITERSASSPPPALTTKRGFIRGLSGRVDPKKELL
jgi:hypothetical protein